MEITALQNISYGLYLVTSRDCEDSYDCENEHDCDDDGECVGTNGARCNFGCIINTVSQITDKPLVELAIAINRCNRTHDAIVNSKLLTISVLDTTTPYSLIERFGFKTGHDEDKFVGFDSVAANAQGLLYLTKHANAYISCYVVDMIEFSTHTMFKVIMSGQEVLNSNPSLTYSHYHAHVKPNPASGWMCTICSYVHESSILPEDIICPLCKFGADVFIKYDKSKEGN